MDPSLKNAGIPTPRALVAATTAVAVSRGLGPTTAAIINRAGLTYHEYFALPQDEADSLWETLAAEAPASKDFPMIEAEPDARLPARQEHRP